METLATPALTLHSLVTLTTRCATEFLDITDRIAGVVRQAGLWQGLVNVQTRHTTTAIVVNEHEPLLLEDFAALLDRTAPTGQAYRHDDFSERSVNVTLHERVNGHAHCRALVLPSSACLNVAGGTLQLGVWQRVFLVELDGPRERELSVLVSGEARL
jgi:secondary thiamine-phosphate synthase enzyme